MREPSSGVISLEGMDITQWGVREIREAGVGFIPEDRHRHGMLLDAPLWENVILGHQTQAPNVGAGGLINAKAAKTDTDQIVKDYDVRTPSIFVTGGLPLRRQPAEAHHRARDEPTSPRSSWPLTRPAASTSAPRPRSGTTSSRPAGPVWPSC